MPIAKRYAVLSMVCLFLIGGSWNEAGVLQANQQMISGRVVFDNREGCGGCEVRIELGGPRPTASTYADPNGHFMFTGLRPGSYMLRVIVDGIEETEQALEVYENMIQASITIPISRRVIVRREPAGSPVVDVSQFLDRYPKKAVERYRRASESAKRNQTQDAIRWLEQAIQIAPDFYHAHNELGLLYKNAGRFQDAER
ncbi:MAG: carboxypeptidase regulatory-like domain-containing protein, partial [Acidobacteria bacterium]|nr:carboxypeptidase regulatory-like domain-containing protein [Acidobacteriota bacterium]